MISKKKMINELFPKLGGLPKSVTDEFLKNSNDEMLLYSPHYSSNESSKGSYYCLKCGSKGDIEGERIICPECHNQNIRPFVNRSYYNKDKGNCRYVSFVDGHIVLQDFHWFVEEAAEFGQRIGIDEAVRIIISDSDFAMYEGSSRYSREGQREFFWMKRKKLDYELNKYSVSFANKELLKHPTVLKIKNFLSEPRSTLSEALNILFSTKSENEIQMPIVSFPEYDYSIIDEAGSWQVKRIAEPIPGTDKFEKHLCWCSNCGEFHEGIREIKQNNDMSSCIKCGTSRYQHYKLFIIVDGIETEDNGVLLRIHGVRKNREFADELLKGVNPKVKISYQSEYTEYILISPNGNINLFNNVGKEMEHMLTPKERYDFEEKILYTDAAKELIQNSKAIKRTGFKEWMYEGATPRYFEYLKGMPILEIFSKMGMSSLVHDILSKDLSDIPQYLKNNGKDSRIAKLTRPQIDSLKNSTVSLKVLIAYMRVLNKDENVLFEDFNYVASHSHERHILDIMNVGVPGMTVAKIKNYMIRVDDSQCCPPSESMQLWADYLRMLRDIEAELSDKKLVFTNSLKREHDKASRKVQQVQNEKLREAFEKKAEDNEWLTFKGKSMTAVVPHLMTELYEEGRKLNHCVGSYAKSVSEGRSIIAFVRKNKNLSEPFCTVEVRDNKIVQARGLSNREGTAFPGVKNFLTEWSKAKGLELEVA